MKHLNKKIPLVFDLDGTLTQTDCFWEAAVGLVTRHPTALPAFFLDILKTEKSKAGIKSVLVRYTDIGHRRVPIRPETLELLLKAKAESRPRILCTGSPKLWADEFVKQIEELTGVKKIFTKVLASTDTLNLIKEKKVLALRQFYPEFDYVGNSTHDIPIWKAANTALFAGHCQKTKRLAARHGIELQEISPAPYAPSWSKALRVHQWMKNFLIFVPVLSAHAYTNSVAVGTSLAAFIAFCLAASGNYLLNDSGDAGNDRAHPSKRTRPIASGEISIPHALLVAAALITSGIALAFFTSQTLGWVLISYLATATFYSNKGKEIPILDTTILAGLYCARIGAGSAATGIPISSWLMATALFLFFSLALGKRDAELASNQKTHGRGYEADDRTSIAALGSASSIAAIVMLCLYTQSAEASDIYDKSPWLWALPTLGLFWASRFWLLCGRGLMKEDPVLWAAKDRTSWIVAGLVGASILLAKLT